MDQTYFPTAVARSTVLQQLAHAIGAVIPSSGDVPADHIAAAMQTAVQTDTWLPLDKRRANHEHYARHLIYADPRGRFSILSIVWAPGQISPPHTHLTWSCTAIYQGTLAESILELPQAGAPPVEQRQNMRGTGSVRFDPAENHIHRFANRCTKDAISLHVYGVRGDLVAKGINRVVAQG